MSTNLLGTTDRLLSSDKIKLLREINLIWNGAKRFNSSYRVAVTGLVGSGRTLFLSAVAQRARQDKYVVTEILSSEVHSLSGFLDQYIRPMLDVFYGAEQTRLNAIVGFELLEALSREEKTLASLGDSTQCASLLAPLFNEVLMSLKYSGKSWMLVIDDIDLMPSYLAEAIFKAVETCNMRQHTLMLVVSGLPQLVEVVKRVYRIKSNFISKSLKPLNSASVRSFLEVSLADRGLQFTVSALAEMLELTKGHVLIMGALLDYACTEATNGLITRDSVLQAYPKMLAMLDRCVYSQFVDDVPSQEKQLLTAMTALGEGPYLVNHICEQSDLTISEVQTRRRRLVSRRLIHQTDLGQLEFSIPLLNEYIQRSQQKIENEMSSN